MHITKPISRGSSASQPSSGLRCGTKNQPWLLEAPAGQRINISLFDFTPSVTAEGHEPTRTSQTQTLGSSNARCSNSPDQHQYGYIIERSTSTANHKNVSICGGAGSQRLTGVYLSTSSAVELVLQNTEASSVNYLLQVRGAKKLYFHVYCDKTLQFRQIYL